jgi:electron transfer flavoprotein beta subunit
MGIRKANKREYPVWSAEDLCAATEADMECFGLIGSPTKVVKVFTPPPREGDCELIPADDVRQAAGTLAERILGEKIL